MVKEGSRKLKRESYARPKINQFDHFWEVECPSCGRKIDLEVLVNLLKKEVKK